MEVLVNLSFYLMWFFLAITLFGLYKPWLALWWSAYANRKKVLQYYGSICLLLIIMYGLLTM